MVKTQSVGRAYGKYMDGARDAYPRVNVLKLDFS